MPRPIHPQQEQLKTDDENDEDQTNTTTTNIPNLTFQMTPENDEKQQQSSKSVKDRMFLSTDDTSCLLFTQTITSPMLTPSEENIDFLKGFQKTEESPPLVEGADVIDDVTASAAKIEIEFAKAFTEPIYENVDSITAKEEHIYENIEEIQVSTTAVNEESKIAVNEEEDLTKAIHENEDGVAVQKSVTNNCSIVSVCCVFYCM